MVAEATLKIYIPAPVVRFIIFPPDLQELEDERRWDRSFANSQDALARLADEALAEHHAGRTEPLDPDTL
jgi:hypothetical protein